MTAERRVSAYTKRASTNEGKLSLAAARAALRVIDLLHSAKNQSGNSSKDIASKMEVTEGRVSQILNGDGNLHIASIARVLGACGYELHLSATPAQKGVPALGHRRREPRRRAKKNSGWHAFEQSYVSSKGVTTKVQLLNDMDGETPIPLGGPVHMGRLTHRADGPFKAQVAKEADAWPQKAQNAIEHEGVLNDRQRALQGQA